MMNLSFDCKLMIVASLKSEIRTMESELSDLKTRSVREGAEQMRKGHIEYWEIELDKTVKALKEFELWSLLPENL